MSSLLCATTTTKKATQEPQEIKTHIKANDRKKKKTKKTPVMKRKQERPQVGGSEVPATVRHLGVLKAGCLKCTMQECEAGKTFI